MNIRTYVVLGSIAALLAYSVSGCADTPEGNGSSSSHQDTNDDATGGAGGSASTSSWGSWSSGSSGSRTTSGGDDAGTSSGGDTGTSSGGDSGTSSGGDTGTSSGGNDGAGGGGGFKLDHLPSCMATQCFDVEATKTLSDIEVEASACDGKEPAVTLYQYDDNGKLVPADGVSVGIQGDGKQCAGQLDIDPNATKFDGLSLDHYVVCVTYVGVSSAGDITVYSKAGLECTTNAEYHGTCDACSSSGEGGGGAGSGGGSGCATPKPSYGW